ncbi:hypothetical protein MLD38_014388 [Melastoma candidum]|uniref:Uncharacterized protein n=1 Tax=Melastoma candidum TaxID=119954 RepID=A0ACB9RCJ7_9MYRT|nr:hypothetical protein MLD38_014388 [Melastoma candidum]
MLRLWQLRRVRALFSRLEKDSNYRCSWLRCTKLTFVDYPLLGKCVGSGTHYDCRPCRPHLGIKMLYK